MMLPRAEDAEGCTCPRWRPTARDEDGDPCDYECPDQDCHCDVHCRIEGDDE